MSGREAGADARGMSRGVEHISQDRREGWFRKVHNGHARVSRVPVGADAPRRRTPQRAQTSPGSFLWLQTWQSQKLSSVGRSAGARKRVTLGEDFRKPA